MQTPKRLRREVRAALQPLANDFKRWESGAIDSFDLKALIHDFHQGAGRQIYLRYDTPDPSFLVANAIVQGILDPKTISPEIITELAPMIELRRSWLEDQDQDTEAETGSNGPA